MWPQLLANDSKKDAPRHLFKGKTLMAKSSEAQDLGEEKARNRQLQSPLALYQLHALNEIEGQEGAESKKQ